MPKIRLRTTKVGRDLDGHIFASPKQAREWLRQPFVSNDKYKIEVIEVAYCECCKQEVSPKVIGEFTVSAFLGLPVDNELWA